MNDKFIHILIDNLNSIGKRLDKLELLIKAITKADKKNMTIKQVAEYSSMSEVTIRRAVYNGSLKPFKTSGKKLFRIDEVDRWLLS